MYPRSPDDSRRAPLRTPSACPSSVARITARSFAAFAFFCECQSPKSSWSSETPIEIVETGLRPGEKLREQYLADTDPTSPGPSRQILVARPPRPATFDSTVVVAELRALAEACNRDRIRERLVELLPDHEAHLG